MKTLIIEDERLAADRLISMLQHAAPDIEIIARLESVEDSVNWLTQHPAPDLIFMDIQLDDGISFEIFDAIKTEAPVIFTTAYDEYAIRAFKVNSIDYLLKPVEEEALKESLSKFRKVYSITTNYGQLFNVVNQLSPSFKTRFFVKIGLRFISIPVEDVACFFVVERCSFLKVRIGKEYAIDYSLDQLQKKLDPEIFFRISRNYIVNIHSVTEIISYSTNRLKVVLEDFRKEEVIVSRDNVADFKRWLDR
ncbi:MAG TPA: LytTR family DNA-binding domain-containing protein [Bacteroidales bacterium]|nr:LytTR family DNA-binding domain-containing protein [Bacteroidales bacterium]